MGRSGVRAARHLVSINQAAEYTGLSAKTIRRRIADGTIRGYRAGPKRVVVDADDLDDRLLRPIPAGGGGDAA
jgi:excisionase family DNA binding protein